MSDSAISTTPTAESYPSTGFAAAPPAEQFALLAQLARVASAAQELDGTASPGLRSGDPTRERAAALRAQARTAVRLRQAAARHTARIDRILSDLHGSGALRTTPPPPPTPTATPKDLSALKASVHREWSLLPVGKQRALLEHVERAARQSIVSLEQRLLVDPPLSDVRHELELARRQAEQALARVYQDQDARPLLSQLFPSGRALEERALEAAAHVGLLELREQDLLAERLPIHAHALDREQHERRYAAEILDRQRELARDPERRRAFESFAKERNALVGVQARDIEAKFVVAVETQTNDGSFFILANPERRVAVDSQALTRPMEMATIIQIGPDRQPRPIECSPTRARELAPSR